MKILGGITAAFIAICVGSLIKAYVGFTLYQWFAIPMGAPQYSVGQLYGGMFLFGYLISDAIKSPDAEEVQSVGAAIAVGIMKSLIYAAVFLGSGWIIKQVVY